MLKKVIQKLREGMLREIIAETKWIYRQAKPYRGSILLYILLGVAAILLGLGREPTVGKKQKALL